MRRILALLALLLSGLLSLDAWGNPPLRPCQEYRTIMWIGDSAGRQPEKFPLFCQRLREMGVNTAMVSGDADPAPFLENHFPYYVENMVNRGLCLKWNSSVTNWEALLADWNKGGRSKSKFVRDYCLEDPQWRESARKQVAAIVTRNAPHQPLAYNLRDELSVTYSANPFDYDFNPVTLAGFRQWLKTQYPDLNALNSEWETSFAKWDDVTPFTTDEIKNRMSSGQPLPHGNPDWQVLETLKFDPNMARSSPSRWNFSPWADFRTYMDVSLAATLDDFRQAAHKIDPQTPVGIEGTQMPSAFGGYDLWRLSRVLDWVEAYDIGNAREIFGSFMPGQRILTTVFESDADHAQRRLWHLLLEGDRGCIVWWSEDCIDFKSPDYALTPKAKALAPVLKEMTFPLAQLFLRAERTVQPIYIYYSQPSVQVDWLLESTVDGSTWPRRFSSFEAAHNHAAQARDGWLKALQDLGYSPVFISSEQMAGGQPRLDTNAYVVLSSAYALSDNEWQRLQKSVPKSHIFFDEWPGTFDEHGKLRKIPLADIVDPAQQFRGDPALYASDRLKQNVPANSNDLAHWLDPRLQEARIITPLPSESRVRVYNFPVPKFDAQLLAFERNVEYAMSESLQQAGGNEALEKPIQVEVTLPTALPVYDLKAQTYLGRIQHLQFNLDPWHPSLFAVTTNEIPAESVIPNLTEQK
jgi:hypothetical protein